MNETEPKIRAFLARIIPNSFRDTDDIFALGFVNSMFAMQLVMFVEQEFGLTITDEDLTLDNFRSVAAIAQLVARKQAGEG